MIRALRVSFFKSQNVSYSFIRNTSFKSLPFEQNGQPISQEEMIQKHPPFYMDQIPREPAKPSNAIELYFKEKSASERIDDNKYTLTNARQEWELMDDADKTKFLDAAVEDLMRYKKELDAFQKLMNSTLTLAQLVKWLSSKDALNLIGKGSQNKKEDNAVKRPRNPFMFFSLEYRKEHPNRAISLKELSEKWKLVSEEEKEHYRTKTLNDRKRYDQERKKLGYPV